MRQIHWSTYLFQSHLFMSFCEIQFLKNNKTQKKSLFLRLCWEGERIEEESYRHAIMVGKVHQAHGFQPDSECLQ